MTGSRYQKLAMRTNDGMASDRLANHNLPFGSDKIVDFGDLINACLGLSGEVGEFNDMVKKWVFHESDFDIEHAKREAGDIAWYLALLCSAFGWDMDEIMQKNIDKLIARYPDGFNSHDANCRKDGDI